MRIDPEGDRWMAATARRRSGGSAWRPLLTAVMALADGKGELLRHAERPWASVTFSGTRHSIALTFTGAEAVAAGEAFLEAVPEHEFTLPGQLVADAAVTAVEQEMYPEPKLTTEVEFLLLADV